MTRAEAAPRPGLGQYLGYAAGEVANNLTFQMASIFLLIYYTDVAGIPAAAAGTIFLVVRVWGGFTDLIAGHRIDRTSTRWGRFRPYLLLGSPPLLILLVALFSIPGSLGAEGRIAWAFVTYALFSLAYSFVNIPYGSLAAAMTQRADARAKYSTSRSIAASLTILLIVAIVAPQIDVAADLQRSLTITTVVFAVVGFALYAWCFVTSREVVERHPADVGARQAVAMLRQNRPLLVLCASALLFLAGMFSVSTVAVYYARDVLGAAELYIVLTVAQTAAMVGASAFVPRAVGAIGKKRAYIAAGVVAAVGALGFALAPASAPAIAVGCYAILGIGLGALNTLIFALQADTVEYGEWRSGIRAEGGNYAVFSFTRKAAQAIGGAAAAYTIALGGYVSGAAAHSETALTSIRIAAGVVPAIGLAVAVAVMLGYPLTEQRVRELIREMAARHAATHAGAAAIPSGTGSP